jgi:hypothetical protein
MPVTKDLSSLEQAANELKMDYSEVEIDGTTFYFRAG